MTQKYGLDLWMRWGFKRRPEMFGGRETLQFQASRPGLFYTDALLSLTAAPRSLITTVCYKKKKKKWGVGWRGLRPTKNTKQAFKRGTTPWSAVDLSADPRPGEVKAQPATGQSQAPPAAHSNETRPRCCVNYWHQPHLPPPSSTPSQALPTLQVASGPVERLWITHPF